MAHIRRPRIIPDFSPQALTMNAAAFVNQAQYHEAMAIVEDTIAIQPNFMPAINCLGNCWKGLGDAQAAVDAYSAALKLAPNDPHLYMNIGATLLDVGQIQDAVNHLITCVTIAPDIAEARWNLALCLLTTGQLQEGWLQAQQRWAAAKFRQTIPNFPLPYWNGEKDAKVLVWGEQGMGERILFLPMLRDLAAHGCHVKFIVDDRCQPLFARSMPEIEFVADGQRFEAGKDLTHQIAIGDLGPFFRSRWEDFPKHAGYLTPHPELRAQMAEAVKATGKRVVGVCWRSANQEYGGHKSMHVLEMVEPLLQEPDTIVINLQYGDTAADQQLVRDVTGREMLTVPDLDLERNFEGLAALMGICDAVVTVSCTHAHLAAAIGVPTYICLPKHNARFWYWFMDRADSPWYPAAQLIRQQRHGYWGDVMARAIEAIKAQLDPGADAIP